MQRTIKSLVIGAIGAAMLTGCASSPSSQAGTSNQANIRSGTVSAIESIAVVEQAVVPTSSGSSAVVTAASSAPKTIAILFNDGTEGRYVVQDAVGDFTLGQPVSVVQTNNGLLIKSP